MNADALASGGSSSPDAPQSSSAPATAAQILMEAASRVLRRRFRVLYLVRRTYRQMLSHSNVLSAVWTDMRTMMRLLLRWVDRSYRRISWTPLVLIAGALLYFVIPLDVVPDTLGAIGFVDDVTVISTVVGRIRHELEQFRNWERAQALPE